MLTTEEIARMSREEKVRVMEAIWTDLSQNAEEVESPAWHKDALEQARARVEAGQEKPVNWERAKEIIRENVK
jgi:glutamine synthetase